MIRNRVLLKSISVFLIIEIFGNALAPAVSWALTAGPTAPEATSFEPVDTTDMVDLKTGDFTYNLPLLEVPGPAGGYPLSLSYHAGITADQEASWTGLGFVVNPGSITRLVNGYPDDHYNVMSVSRRFWEGGYTQTYTVGVSVGIANVASVSAGLTFAQDTYKGFGMGGYAGVGLGTNGISANLTASFAPYGGMSVSAGAGVGIGLATSGSNSLSGSVGISISSDGVGVSAGVSVNNNDKGKITSLLGASIGTDGLGIPVKTYSGSSGPYNGHSNKVSTESGGFQIDVPVYYALSIRLGSSSVRYWVNESEGVGTFGSLYAGKVPSTSTTAFDTYDLPDLSLDAGYHDDSERVLGGSFPDFDQYTVTAQGLGGSIRPYQFRGNLFRQDKYDSNTDHGKYLTKGYALNSDPQGDKPIGFRFVNDFSNRFEYSPGNFSVGASDIKYDFNADEVTGLSGEEGYNKETNQLAGSKHVEWYSNQEILKAVPTKNPFAEGFINCVAAGFERQSDRQIGGYSITNSSGVTYHYALPAYSYDEYMYSENTAQKREENGLSYNELRKPERYAYTWFLTAVTGPDFVDRNNNGLADHGDWGYWVNFEYKKLYADYKWRNPGEGMNRDLDAEFEFYASGKKELYYLEKIVTQTHVAVFEKSARIDGREVIDLRTGGFKPKPRTKKSDEETECSNQCAEALCPQGNCDNTALSQCIQQCDATYEDILLGYEFPRSTARLDKIKLYNYEDFIANKFSDENTLRTISFEYDYELANNTPNSYSEDNFEVKQGKLTLKSVTFFGKKGVSLIPPVRFEYKNVAYPQGDKPDIWGYYKNDYDATFAETTNDVLGRLPTNESAPDVNAWSLTKITTPLGASINVELESDDYDHVVMDRKQVLRIKDVVDLGQDKLKITFWETGISNLSEYFDVGSSVDIDLVGTHTIPINIQGGGDEPDDDDPCEGSASYIARHHSEIYSGGVQIAEVNPSYLIIQNHNYYERLKASKIFTVKAKVKAGRTCPHPGQIKIIDKTFTAAYPNYFPCGVITTNKVQRLGGGLRVKTVAIEGIYSASTEKRETLYEYTNGVTAYEPFEILEPKIHPDFPSEYVRDAKVQFKRGIFGKYSKQLALARLLPPPGVLYGTVTVRERNTTPDGVVHLLDNHSVFEFETLNSGMIGIDSKPVSQANVSGEYQEIAFDKGYYNQVVLKDYSSRTGNLKSVSLFGGNQLISKTINHYLHDDTGDSFEDNMTNYENALSTRFKNQGVTEETYTRAKLAFHDQFDWIAYPSSPNATQYLLDGYSLFASISKQETFPTIQTGQTNINYKTGTTTSSETLEFDFYSGDAVKSVNTDSYGVRYLSKGVPAYKIYVGMGLKTENKANRNMLTQISGQYEYVVNNMNVPTGLLSASVTTWSDRVKVLNLNGPQTNIWRMESSSIWAGETALNVDGTYPLNDFVDFNYAGENSRWQRTSKLTLYDANSHALEAGDINDNYAATRMNNAQTKVVASAANAKYKEMACSGAEYYAGNTEQDGGVFRGNGNPSNARAHTGAYSLLVEPGKSGFNFVLDRTQNDGALAKKYRASVWAYMPGEAETQGDLDRIELVCSVNGSKLASVHPVLQKNKAKSWYLLNLDITAPPATAVVIEVRNNSQRGVYFDDFRIHPLNSAMTSYVYDPFSGELNFILDANNFYTRFEYDAMGRLLRTSKELLNFDYGDGKESFRADAIVQEMKYNYGREH